MPNNRGKRTFLPWLSHDYVRRNGRVLQLMRPCCYCQLLQTACSYASPGLIAGLSRAQLHSRCQIVFTETNRMHHSFPQISPFHLVTKGKGIHHSHTLTLEVTRQLLLHWLSGLICNLIKFSIPGPARLSQLVGGHPVSSQEFRSSLTCSAVYV